ncbi:heme-binding protein [Siculibacillus lacustris]|uniref:Heme-binding protein n=1 Tax=Siculibacillus lacustris TaxID=1549641 RepID=A0A4Q9VX13_9HYPH|nr:heme-binding protein [Siculibacillus lacustris]TBW40783.1 heme-binding protein [Siculibacillus lacustris]
MTDLALSVARSIVDHALTIARDRNLKPMAVVVLDARASLKAAASEDGAPIARWKIAQGKANGALTLGMSSRRLGVLAVERPHFLAGVLSSIDGGAMPVAGGVLIRDRAGVLVGAVGASGDTSDADEALLVTAVEASGLIADVG